MSERIAKFKQLQQQRKKVEKQNNVEIYKERRKNNVKRIQQRQQKQNNLDQQDQQISNKNQDLERKQLWNYSVEDNEKWEEKNRAALENKSANKFNDYNALAEKTFIKRVNEAQKQMNNTENNTNIASKISSEYIFDHRASEKDIDVVSNFMKAAELKKLAKTKRTKAKNEVSTPLYINDKNKEFNEKLARAYKQD